MRTHPVQYRHIDQEYAHTSDTIGILNLNITVVDFTINYRAIINRGERDNYLPYLPQHIYSVAAEQAFLRRKIKRGTVESKRESPRR
jgi:hypothetical protein